MSFGQTFNIGYLKTRSSQGEEIFLSVTENCECGPGIVRDGVTLPRMDDPHRSAMVWGEPPAPQYDLLEEKSFNPFVQRAATWTLFHHLKKFIEEHGDRYLVIGMQSCGDLTMNPWHVALIRRDGIPILCRVPEERFDQRTYRCLVKWRDTDKEHFPWRYSFADLKFVQVLHGFHASIPDEECARLEKRGEWPATGISPLNVTHLIEFALAGKPIIQKGSEIPLNTVIDRFQDVRHIFNLPTVPATGYFRDTHVRKINFGEHELYSSFNARRAALHSPVIVPLHLDGVTVQWENLELALTNELFKPDPQTPTKRGQFRKYDRDSVEIFYPYNVYPFGVLGGKSGELVGLASGGLSGQIGNTLPGITTIMYDFFGCEDALVMDEGLDTFHIVNPNPKAKDDDPDVYEYDNQQLLDELAAFTLARLEKDREDCKKSIGNYPLGEDMAEWPLNRKLVQELRDHCAKFKLKPGQEFRSLAVEPHRSQIRSVLIFAVLKKAGTPRAGRPTRPSGKGRETRRGPRRA